VIDPAGYVVHEAGRSQEIIPIMVDLDQVRLTARRAYAASGSPLRVSATDVSISMSTTALAPT
jgi:hypothetical protein